MEKTNEKKVLLLSFLGVITLILVVVGATYAYFTAQGGTSVNTNVNVQTSTTDNLSFQVGEAISLTANQEDFGSGMGNKSGSTYARATLTANNATNTATRNYYVYLDIENNDFEYTTGDEQAELLLKVTDPDGTEVTNISGLIRKTSGSGDNQVTGFDITTYEDTITIANNYEITSTGTVTQEWQIEVIFVNLDSDQNANTGKTFNATLTIQEETMINSLGNFAEYITQTLYTGTDGENSLYYHDGQGAYINADQEAEDYSYRYAGSNPNNYVCFGSNIETCSIDNLYRIIGVFNNQIKLIKYDYANSNLLGADGAYYGSVQPLETYKGYLETVDRYYWNNSTNTNTWSESNLNIVNLNQNYLNSIDDNWINLIANYNWIVGGNTYSNIVNVPIKNSFTNELINSESSDTYNSKIGLMYVSDYGYAASPENWNINIGSLNNTSNTNNNWLYMGFHEWTITRISDIAASGFRVYSDGSVNNGYVYNDLAIRPSFYLESDVELSGGNGTVTDPYRILL